MNLNDIISSPFFDRDEPIESWKYKLPHLEQKGKFQFVTFRLADSLPQNILKQYFKFKEEFIRNNPLPWSDKTKTHYNKLVTPAMEHYLHQGYGSCLLRQPELRKIVCDCLHHFDEKEIIRLQNYIVMPNHLHFLAIADEKQISEIVKQIKRYTARMINKQIGRKGRLWQREGFDRLTRSEDHLKYIHNYIRNNGHGLPTDDFTYWERKSLTDTSLK